MQLSHRTIGILALLGGVGIIVGTLNFHALTTQQFGAAFFPRLLGGALILCGVLMVIVTPRGVTLGGTPIRTGRSGLRIVALLASVPFWVLVSPVLGFIATTFLLMTALTMLAGGKMIPAVTSGLGLSLLLFLIFGQLLRVPLPYGLLDRLLI